MPQNLLIDELRQLEGQPCFARNSVSIYALPLRSRKHPPIQQPHLFCSGQCFIATDTATAYERHTGQHQDQCHAFEKALKFFMLRSMLIELMRVQLARCLFLMAKDDKKTAKRRATLRRPLINAIAV